MEQNVTILEQMRRGINLARAGDRTGAEAIFDLVLAHRPNHEEALVWKAAVVNDPQETIRCLEQVLRLNPNNQRARVGLEWAHKRIKNEPAVDPIYEQSLEDKNPPAPAPAPASPPATNPSLPLNSGPVRPVVASTAAFQPGQPLKGSSLAGASPDSETKPEAAPYKKRRLSESGDLPPVELPPEAMAWTRSDRAGTLPKTAQGAGGGAASQNSRKKVESKVFRTANAPVAFTVAPPVARASRPREETGSGWQQVPVRWPLLLFGLAVLLAVLSFPLAGLAPLLGIAGVIAALAGVVLFNRALL